MIKHISVYKHLSTCICTGRDSAFRLITHVNPMCIRPQKMALENRSIREVHPEKELTGGGGVLSAEWLSKGSECPLLCEHGHHVPGTISGTVGGHKKGKGSFSLCANAPPPSLS